MTFLPVVAANLAIWSPAGPAVPPTASVEGLESTDASAGSVHLQSPGVTTEWPIGVTTAVLHLDSLRVRVTLPGGPDDELDCHLSISLRGCPVARIGNRCPAVALELAPKTAAAAVGNRSIQLAHTDGTVPKDVNLLLGVTLDDTVGQQVQGETALIRVQVVANGVLEASGIAGKSQTNQGLGLMDALLTGIAAVTSSLFLAGLRRLQTRVHQP